MNRSSQLTPLLLHYIDNIIVRGGGGDRGGRSGFGGGGGGGGRVFDRNATSFTGHFDDRKN